MKEGKSGLLQKTCLQIYGIYIHDLCKKMLNTAVGFIKYDNGHVMLYIYIYI